MSFRYRERTVVDGEAIDPYDWTENTNAFVGELNGKLDRDNFPERSITTGMVTFRACNRIFSRQEDGDSSWDLSRKFQIFTKEITVPIEDDGVFIVHFGCTWEWQGLINNPTFTTANSQYFNIRLSVNGTLVAKGRNFSLGTGANSVYLVGTIPVISGINRITATAVYGADIALISKYTVVFKDRLLTVEYKRR